MESKKQMQDKIQELKPYLEKKYGIDRIGIFGSYARNEENENSDLDLLVHFARPIGWEFIDIKEFLEKELDIDVDLVTENALKHQLKDQILNEVIYQ